MSSGASLHSSMARYVSRVRVFGAFRRRGFTISAVISVISDPMHGVAPSRKSGSGGGTISSSRVCNNGQGKGLVITVISTMVHSLCMDPRFGRILREISQVTHYRH